MKRFALILLALAATVACSRAAGTVAAAPRSPVPPPTLAPTATAGADNPVEGALDELATDMPGSLEGGAATTAPLDENAGDVNDTGVDPGRDQCAAHRVKPQSWTKPRGRPAKRRPLQNFRKKMA